MKLEDIRNSIVPNIIFFIAVLYLLYSGLSITKGITLQNDAIVSFMKGLSEKDILFAIIDTLKIVFVQIVLPLLPFLLLIALGFLTVFVLKEKTNSKLFLGILIAFFAVAAILASFSVIILFIYAGILISSIFTLRFGPGKNNFSTGNSLTFRNLGWMNILIAVGLFFTMYLNFPVYEQTFMQSNMDLIKNFVPNTDQIQKFQVEMVNKTIDDIKLSLTQKCQQSDPIIRDQCIAAYDTVIADMDSYKENITNQASNQNVTDEQLRTYVVQTFPIIEQFVKAMPLFLSLAFFAMLEILKPFIALLFGAVHSALGKFT